MSTTSEERDTIVSAIGETEAALAENEARRRQLADSQETARRLGDAAAVREAREQIEDLEIEATPLRDRMLEQKIALRRVDLRLADAESFAAGAAVAEAGAELARVQRENAEREQTAQRGLLAAQARAGRAKQQQEELYRGSR